MRSRKPPYRRHTIRSFETLPPRNGGVAILASRLIAVLQGWDVSEEEIEMQLRSAERAGTGGSVLSYVKIDQSWQPKNVKKRR